MADIAGNAKNIAISLDSYKAELGCDPERLKSALATALDTRKYEIDLYWRRAAYFWTFIAAAFIAYGTLIGKGDPGNAHYGLQELFACLGFSFSIAWWYVNAGSRFWQQNWEYQVDLLEDFVHGPLYKTVHYNRKEEKRFTGAKPYSLAKLNQLTVQIIIVAWGLLVLNATFHLSPLLHNASSQLLARTHGYDIAAVTGLPSCYGVWRYLKSEGKSQHSSDRADVQSGLVR